MGFFLLFPMMSMGLRLAAGALLLPVVRGPVPAQSSYYQMAYKISYIEVAIS